MRFLSPEWLSALADAVPRHEAGGGAEHGLKLGQIVEGGPEGDVRYTIHLGAADVGSSRLEAGSVEDADVVLLESYETAVGIASGALTPARAIREERIKVRGAAKLLASNAGLLSELAGALEEVRAATRF